MYRRNAQQWTGLLLSLILLTQYVHYCAAKIHFHKREDGNYGMCPKSTGKEICLREDQPKKREKRLVTAVLFAISIFAMVANLAFDIYLQVKGCCGLYPSACDYRDEFLEIRDELKNRSNAMNTRFTQAENLREIIQALNLNNADIWLELNRIMILTERLITRIDARILTKLNNQSVMLKNAIAAHNRTVMNMGNQQISMEYNGIFSSVKTAAIGLAPLVGMLGLKAISAGINWYKGYRAGKQINEMAKLGRLRSNAVTTKTGMGTAEVGKLSSKTASTTAKGAQAASKAAKFVKVAGAVMSIISIGMEIYTAYKKVKACQDVRDDMKKALDTIKPERAEFAKTERNLTLFENELRQLYIDTHANLTNENFLNYTLVVHQLAQGADIQTQKLKDAQANITTFHDNIVGADKARTLSLQRTLIAAMQAVEYTWECFDKKLSTMAYVRDHCEKGSNSIDFLFNTAVEFYNAHSERCTSSTGHRYTTLAATEGYVKLLMRENNFYEDCILNNGDVRYVVCSQWAQGYSNEELGTKNQLTVAQVQEIVGKCPPADVSPRVKDLICSRKVVDSLAKTKEKFSRYNQQQVETAYNACPPPALPRALKDLICIKKNQGYDENWVLNEYNQYHAASIRTHYRSCAITIPQSTKDTICTLKLYSYSLEKTQEMFNTYPPEKVAEAFNACP